MNVAAVCQLFSKNARAKRLKNSNQSAILDAFYTLKNIDKWSQGVRCLDWVTRKDALSLTVQWSRRCDPSSLGNVPACFVLPRDQTSWDTAASAAKSSWWIAKPVNSSNSDGIRLLSAKEASLEFNGSSVTHKSPPPVGAADNNRVGGPGTVLQQYVPSPRLIAGLKFDLRLYVLVLRRGNAAPSAYIFTDGLARFATEPYFCPHGVEGPSQRKADTHGVGQSASSLSTPTADKMAPQAPDLAPPLLRAHLTNYSRQVQDERSYGDRIVDMLHSIRSSVGSGSQPTQPPHSGSVFIESLDDQGSGGVDKVTGKVLSHKWSARCALSFIAAEDKGVSAVVAPLAASTVAASPVSHVPVASPSPCTFVGDNVPFKAGGSPTPLWATACRAIAEAVAQSATVDDLLSPTPSSSTSSSGTNCFELIGIDVLPDTDGECGL